MTEFLGTAAPFYISRHRLRLITDRVGRGGATLSGTLQFPGVGQMQIDRERVDAATGAQLERAVDWLIEHGAIGDPQHDDCQYAWLWLSGKMVRVAAVGQGVDHLIAADIRAQVPSGWCCLVVGSRVNLTALAETEVPELGSSPMAIQTALSLLDQGPPAPPITSSSKKPQRETCTRILHAAEVIQAEPTALTWGMAGLVEVLVRCSKERVLLGAPLFLTYYI